MTYMITPNRISREMNRAFNQFFGGPDGECCAFNPRVNIRETENDVTLTFEVPGISKDDIKVTVENNVLTVSGERTFIEKDEKTTYLRNEIATGKFSRSFTLPQTIATEKIGADYHQGLLTISMSRKEEAKPKQIEVQVQ